MATLVFDRKITIGDKYGPAMTIEDQVEADEYFEWCVDHSMRFGGMSREEAERVEKVNLGYYAGYYGHATRLRVERLFRCSHPVFGSASAGQPSPDAAMMAGVVRAAGLKKA